MRAIAISIFILCAVIYVHNLAPNWGAMTQFNTWDGLEYVITACVLGIDHPPGHPLYLLLCKLFTEFPFGNPSWNINLLSALSGAAAVAFLFLALMEALRPLNAGRWASVLTSVAVSLTIAFSYVFWSHCEIPEVHTLLLAFTGACMYALLKWNAARGANSWLCIAALCLAMGIGVNILAVFALMPPAIVLVAVSSRGRRGGHLRLIVPAAIFLAGFIPYLYYPMRIAKWPNLYSHPMNYLGPHEMGTTVWYFWYIGGKAWTGGQMFFLNRLLPNIPLYLSFALRDLGPILLAFSIVGVLLCFAEFKGLIQALRAGDGAATRERLALPFLLLLFLFSWLPEISIHDPSNPRAREYLVNFFLPSLYILAVLGAYGALRAYLFLKSRAGDLAWLLVALLLAIVPYQLWANYRACDLKGQECAYVYSLRSLKQLPPGSVIVSKLVYGMLKTFFSEVDHAIPADKIAIYDPEMITLKLSRESKDKDFFARRNSMMRGDLERLVEKGAAVFIAGDVVDEDKSPEKLLLSDLDLVRWVPTLTREEKSLSFPRELFLYRVTGLRRATAVKAVPAGIERGSVDSGRFANGIELLGFRTLRPDRGIRADMLSFELFWKTTQPIDGDVYVGAVFLNERLQRVGEPCWHTLGGSLSASDWNPGSVIAERINFFPPPLWPGRYHVAIGMVDDRGNEVAYFPSDAALSGRTYSYVLLASFGVGAPPPPGG
jgi:4-amino-4-deoxy-L-arabinose transferase-like glycosyltransferase